MGEGRELRTEIGRAEVLLTPGVFLRIDRNSSIRMLSNQLSDTRVEVLGGSAILEAREGAALNASVTLIHKNWEVKIPRPGVYRIDSNPPQLRVYQGEVQVAAGGQAGTVTVQEGEILPLAAVLVPEQSAVPERDSFKNWAMSRSDAISADDQTTAGIAEDPGQIDSAGLAGGGFSYFPPMGVSSLGLANPYGLSSWSPYQSTLSFTYFPPYLYGPYPGWLGGLGHYPRPSVFPLGTGTGLRTGGTFAPPVLLMPTPRTTPRGIGPHAGTPHVAPARVAPARVAPARVAAPPIGGRAAGHR